MKRSAGGSEAASLTPVVFGFQEQAWTSSTSRDGARRLQVALLKAGGWKDSTHLLMGGKEEDHRGILGGVLDILQPQMSK